MRRLEMDNLISEINERLKQVSINADVDKLFIVFTIQFNMESYKISQIAADYAKLNYQDFAVVIQRFFSKAKADCFPVEFLSNVCSYKYKITY